MPGPYPSRPAQQPDRPPIAVPAGPSASFAALAYRRAPFASAGPARPPAASWRVPAARYPCAAARPGLPGRGRDIPASTVGRQAALFVTPIIFIVGIIFIPGVIIRNVIVVIARVVIDGQVIRRQLIDNQRG